jgi:hypothetical protein
MAKQHWPVGIELAPFATRKKGQVNNKASKKEIFFS